MEAQEAQEAHAVEVDEFRTYYRLSASRSFLCEIHTRHTSHTDAHGHRAKRNTAEDGHVAAALD
eukprot:COSAG06_NODE_9371_length_1918_cov_3.269379_2_plen_64_part_00